MLAMLAFAPLARAQDSDDEVGDAEIFLENNQTDGDAEIVILIDAEVGLKRVKVLPPNSNRPIIALEAKNFPNLGVKEILVETPEPSLEEVKAVYPPGTYRVRGRKLDGGVLEQDMELSHDLLTAPAITFPAAGADDVSTRGFVIRWNAVPGAAAYEIEVEQEELEIVLKADVQADATSFRVPNGYLLPNSEYTVGVAVIAGNGNKSVSEAVFNTGN